jgi:hypothetical protein
MWKLLKIYLTKLLRNITRLVEYLLWGFGPPMPPTDLKYERINDMKQVSIKLFWEPSISSDVVDQQLEIYVGGELVVSKSLLPEISSYEPLVLDAHDTVLAKVRAYDGLFYSPWAVLEFVLPDLDAPLPPTLFGWDIVEVIDVEEPVEEPAEEPAEEPVEEPAEEPAEEPVEEPTE